MLSCRVRATKGFTLHLTIANMDKLTWVILIANRVKFTITYPIVSRIHGSVRACRILIKETHLFIGLVLARPPEVISSSHLKAPLCMVFKQFNFLVQNFGTLSHCSHALLALLWLFVQN